MPKEKSPERLKLEAEASLLEIPFGANWKDETIADKIAEAKAAMSDKMQGAEAGEQIASAPISGGDGEPEVAGEAEGAPATTEKSGEMALPPDTGAGEVGYTAPAQPDPAATFTVDPELEPGAEGALIVTGPKKGRWRAGRHFTREPSIILVTDLTDGQREMIEGDPKLTVEFVPPED